MSDSYKTPSHNTVLCKLHSSPSLKTITIMEMYLFVLVNLTLLSIHISDLLSNIMRGDCYLTTSRSLFTNSLFITLKCARYINVVHDALYQISELNR